MTRQDKPSPPSPIPYQEAQRQLLSLARPLAGEMRPLAQAIGRYLANPLCARRTQPAADLSAMDGYAVRADELLGPWRIVGESAAGHPYTSALDRGEAVRISTGALLPERAGAILLQENARRDDARLTLRGSDGPSARHIRRAGLDFCEGTTLIARGSRLTPARIALALSGGHHAAEITRRPRIAILDNGDELVAHPAHAARHQIPASNGAMVTAMSQPFAQDIRRIGPLPDSRVAICEGLMQADEADVIVTSGGASVGDHDLVHAALEDWGAQFAFWRIAIKPGKPLLVATRGKQIILGLPGNPVSSFVTAWLFLLPLLRHLGGAAEPMPRRIMLPCTHPLPANGKRTTFARATLCDKGITAIEQQDSGALAALSACDALLERPIGAPSTTAGQSVPVYLLGDAAGA